MSYVPSTNEQRNEMLKAVGVKKYEDLYANVDKSVLISKLDLPEGTSELEVSKKMKNIASKNRVYKTIFRGAGAYNHYIPAIVKSVASKEELMLRAKLGKSAMEILENNNCLKDMPNSMQMNLFD